ncbi:helix-turn-helix transcriptional regulator [Pedobacter sp. MC2016-14]|uniref:AraC family transcriptional regulator n=1 Tax=Pedobacter sp. MC2016-14 TaxID=2897327 RepID=UPI001E5E0E03|nr:helix-turn-helix domain-containing protein [Pedobacter sp. MC2016-14]MCD0488980.1 helix-turn-helix transcriptional regulator [Pedobacter sp. MC2016-14]
MSQPLPFQSIPFPAPLQIVRMLDFHDPSSDFPHRHDFFMCYWTTEGKGKHLIDFEPYIMTRGRLFFLHQNQVHQVSEYANDGWMVMFNGVCFQEFLKMNPKQEQNGLFDYFNARPWVDLGEDLIEQFETIANLMTVEANERFNMDILQHYLSILLLFAARKYAQDNSLTIQGIDTEQLRKLKVLIESNFRTNRESTFYASSLGYSPRKLNALCYRTMGVSIQDMINQRLLAEIEAGLVGSNRSLKEISFELGFVDQSHMATFFKKHRAERPSDFRNRYLP